MPTDSNTSDLTYIQSATFEDPSGDYDYELELSWDEHNDRFWVFLYLDHKHIETASLAAANDFEEIGDFWLGQFPRMNRQISEWAQEYPRSATWADQSRAPST